MSKAKHMIHLVGVDVCAMSAGSSEIPEDVKAVVCSTRILSVVTRENPLPDGCEIVPITPLQDAYARIEEILELGSVMVFASGDPLFFGIGKNLVARFGSGNIVVKPALSSIQHAFAYFKIPWDDAVLCSGHGRNANIVGQVLAYDKVAVLTDGKQTPAVIAGKILDYLDDERCSRFKVFVAENIGHDSERFLAGDLQTIQNSQFGSLCCMILLRQSRSKQEGFGLSEQDIHHSRGLITKREVRAAVLHMLQLQPGSVFWDVGAGSGSVSIEAARLVPDMLVYSIEREVEQHRNIDANIKKFDIFNLKLIQGEAPSALGDLAAPDRVFIGGSGGNLKEIIRECSQRLAPGGRLVVTGVLEKTCTQAPQYLHENGLKVETSRISVERNSYPQIPETSITLNPITIIVGRKNNN